MSSEQPTSGEGNGATPAAQRRELADRADLNGTHRLEQGGAAGCRDQMVCDAAAGRFGLGSHLDVTQHDVTVERCQQTFDRQRPVSVDRRVRCRRQVAVTAELGEESPLGVDSSPADCVLDRTEQLDGLGRRRGGTPRPTRPARPAAASCRGIEHLGRRRRRGRCRAVPPRPAPSRSRHRRGCASGGWRCCRAAR